MATNLVPYGAGCAADGQTVWILSQQGWSQYQQQTHQHAIGSQGLQNPGPYPGMGQVAGINSGVTGIGVQGVSSVPNDPYNGFTHTQAYSDLPGGISTAQGSVLNDPGHSHGWWPTIGQSADPNVPDILPAPFTGAWKEGDSLASAMTAAGHDIDYITHTCKGCGRSVADLILRDSVECDESLNITAPGVAEPEKPRLTLGDMWSVERWGGPAPSSLR